ncbi:ABC-type spermidine/putrescine transport system permease subunit I [Rhodobium orientis]|uniref:ABC transporter permease n=1 Tax=Rhodobium orientis TaxID=34017 RepID=UPI0014740B51|nr:ABC transporter permease [Rhodobium orientis]MBB4304586.1 ABC-type spermidine/putrescine transport system permease subunit I [Rhodobium orientis]
MFRPPTQVDPKGHGSFVLIWSFAALLPVVGLVLWSVLSMQNFRLVWEPSLQAYYDVLASGRWEVTVRTLRIAAIVTLIEIVLAVPFALWIAKGTRSIAVRTTCLGLLTIPFFLSLASRTIVWRGILGLNGPLNAVLMHLGIVDQPLDWLLFSEFSVVLGLIGPYFPPMVFPLFLAFALIDDEVLEASKDLGAPPSFTFLHVILPLAMPGLGAGIVFTFVPMIGDPVVPALLGGGNVIVLSASVQSLLRILNYTVAAALSVLMLAILVAIIGAAGALSARMARGRLA